MHALRLRLFGTPALLRSTGDEPLLPERLTQLAVILAARSDWTTRDQLIALLWPDLDDEAARRKLRSCFSRPAAPVVRRPGGARRRAALARGFRPRRLRCGLRAAGLGACRRDLRERLLQRLRAQGSRAVGRVAALRAQPSRRPRIARPWRSVWRKRDDMPARESLARQWLASDPLDEDALAALAEALHAQGRPGDARRAAGGFVQRLVQKSASSRPTRARARAAPPRRRGRRSPCCGGFVGRRAELGRGRGAAVARTMPCADLTGPGGAGKSRLVKQACHGSRPASATVHWIALDDLTDAAQVARICTELQLTSESTPCSALHAPVHRSLVLVLDNCEHLRELARSDRARSPMRTGGEAAATSRAPLG